MEQLTAYARFLYAMLERGVYLPPAQFEAAFVSLCHGEAEIEAVNGALGVANGVERTTVSTI